MEYGRHNDVTFSRSRGSSKMDKEFLLEKAIVKAWCMKDGPAKTELKKEIDRMFAELSQVGDAAMPMSQVCDEAMPRMGRRHPYWWSEELAELRRNCNAARRRYTRSRGRRCRDEAEEGRLYNIYIAAAEKLRTAIDQAKEEAKQEAGASPHGQPPHAIDSLE